MSSEISSLPLVPGRQCGECTACCTWIRVVELDKSAGVACPHCQKNVGCQIYERRPEPCRGWYCGWRLLPGLADELRPDRSGVIVVFEDKASIKYESQRRVNFIVFGKDHAMLDDAFVQMTATCVANKVPTVISSLRVLDEAGVAELNDFVYEAAVAGDLERVALQVGKALEELSTLLRLGDALVDLSSRPFDPGVATRV